MTLEELGYNKELEQFRSDENLTDLEAGRVITENRERYKVITGNRVLECELLGNLRFTAESRSDLPAVGDWVSIAPYDESRGIIHRIFPRKSILERQAVGKFGEKQIIAVNIDIAMILQAVDRDYNINRLERYITICHSGGIGYIVVLTKKDLISDDDLKEKIAGIRDRIPDVTIVPVSNLTHAGYDRLEHLLIKGKTFCLLGSSGVGKSTLINNLAGEQIMETSSISSSTGKGRHMTSHRELIVLEKGGIVIDNPGMREVGITDSGDGLENTFEEIARLSDQCRFSDCTHTEEKDCAVTEALRKGKIEKSLYENFIKLSRERARFQITIAEKRKKDKEFGKIIKDYKNFKKRGEDKGKW